MRALLTSLSTEYALCSDLIFSRSTGVAVAFKVVSMSVFFFRISLR